MHDRRPPVLISPLLRWALVRTRRGEASTQTIVIIILVVVGGIVLLGCVGAIALMIPAYRQVGNAARQAALRAQGQNNLRQIGLALYNYHDAIGQFPPGGIYGEDGTDYHSWQTMILPYLDQSPLYDQIDFNRPWDEPPNSGQFSNVIPQYLQPAITDAPYNAEGFAVSHYAGNSQLLLPNGTTRIPDVTDGASSTIMAGEVAAGFKPWGDPSNLRDPAAGLAIGADTFSGPDTQAATQVLMADGSVRIILNDISPDVLSALATPAGGEAVGEF
jgi:Protein of unknown function (DUF1559)